MSKSELHPEYLRQKALQEALLARKNHKSDWYNGIYDRWEHPVLTREHIPLEWRFDLDPAANPYFMERLGVNAVFNAGAIELDGKFYLVARVEGNDRKSFFAVAESSSPVDGFRFWDKPIELPDTCPEETNVYDMRLTKHKDGWIYGVFCSESKGTSNPDLSAAVAAAGILCTPDCTETAGSCWGFALVYSGNFLIEAQRADGGQRLVMGIHPYHFHWQLEPGGSFAAPEATMVYSGQGLGEMSRRFHRAIRARLLPPRWQDMHAPARCCSTAGRPATSTLTRKNCWPWPPRPGRRTSICSCWTTAGSRGAATPPPAWGTGPQTGTSCPAACPSCAPD